jgi:hypothetical protein
VRLEPARVKPLSGAEFRIGSLLANVRLTSKGLLRANTLANFASLRDKEKSFKTLFGIFFLRHLRRYSIGLKNLPRDEHSILLRHTVTYEEKFHNIATCQSPCCDRGYETFLGVIFTCV